MKKINKKKIIYIIIFLVILICIFCIKKVILYKNINMYNDRIFEYLEKKEFEFIEQIGAKNISFEKRIKKYIDLYKISLEKEDVFFDSKSNNLILLNKLNGKKEYSSETKLYKSEINIFFPFKTSFFKSLEIKKIKGRKYTKKINEIINILEKENIYSGLKTEDFPKSEFEIYENKEYLALFMKDSLPIFILQKKGLKENKNKEQKKQEKKENKKEEFKSLKEEKKKKANVIYFYRYINNKNDTDKIIEVPY